MEPVRRISMCAVRTPANFSRLVTGRRHASLSMQETAGSPFTVVEVGPRDGLQNQKQFVSTRDKVALIERLSDVGFKWVEATSFVSPKWVPQVADHAHVMQKITRSPGVHYPVLIPNEKGLDAALEVGVQDIAIFAAASETFSKKNLNCSIDESLSRFEAVTERALKLGMRIRGYVSCVLGCPYEGHISTPDVAKVASQLLEMGCSEVSLGDTIGVGTPGRMGQLLDDVTKVVPVQNIAVHCHDTYGQALANVLVAIEKGVRTADSSVAGLGGCPYARGASGNLASEDLVYMLHGLGFDTGVDEDKLFHVVEWISKVLEREPDSKVSKAKLAGVRMNVRKTAVRA